MSATEEARFHNDAVAYAEKARIAIDNNLPHTALAWAQLSTAYAIMAQTALHYRTWLGPIGPPS